jgi:prophage antirepressor-like protein
MNLKFNKHNIRIIGTHDTPLFVVKDICKILGLKNPTAVLRNIPDKWKHLLKLSTLNKGDHMTNIVNESGLYKIIMRSNKEIAQPFQEFVKNI